MGGRNTFASGISVADTYKITQTIHGVKVLVGIGTKHSLPEEAHSSRAYIKLRSDGTFQEMRIYGKDKLLKFEIAYHMENKHLHSGRENILHYHIYGLNFERGKAMLMPEKMYQKYKKFFIGVPENALR